MKKLNKFCEDIDYYNIIDDAIEAEVTYEVFESIGTNEKIVFWKDD